MFLNSKIFIAGQKNFVGKYLFKELCKNSYKKIINNNLNIEKLKDIVFLNKFFSENRPEVVFLVGGNSGGIKLNILQPASLMNDNLLIILNVFRLSHKYKVKKLLYLSSSCVYPKNINSSLLPKFLMSNKFEDTNKYYALAKIIGIQMCEAYNKEFKKNFISVIPSTVFGPYDNFVDDNAHVVSSLIKKIHYAKVNNKKTIKLWGTGKPIRDFIYVEDLVKGLIVLLENHNSSEPVNISSGESFTINKLSKLIKKIIDYKGNIYFDINKPDGVKKKILNIDKILKYRWRPEYLIDEALEKTYKWYLRSKYIK